MYDRRSAYQFTAALAAYAAVLALSLHLLLGGLSNAGWRTVVAIAPMLPALAVCVSVVRNLRRADEMQRRLGLEALGLAFAGTALATFGYGFLENVGYPKMSMFAVWPLMASLWVVGLLVAHIRYR